MPAYNYLIDQLEEFPDIHAFLDVLKKGIDAALQKLYEYYSLAESIAYPITIILDPRSKLKYYSEHTHLLCTKAKNDHISGNS